MHCNHRRFARALALAWLVVSNVLLCMALPAAAQTVAMHETAHAEMLANHSCCDTTVQPPCCDDAVAAPAFGAAWSVALLPSPLVASAQPVFVLATPTVVFSAPDAVPETGPPVFLVCCSLLI